ncbi:carbohydrate ABC transporter permease [Ancylobacter dichloromethanicus]|uniref:Binding-protein-dependent transport system inner membrane protein n=1 Tax=Ancylobacter dichloromethanicus TaxID=518825 RepID=A0A9W6JAH1_9HYPH|nr:carbohydrate ABC transporter permease [Ancylobacter dichloromethanicus]MBS7552186.1 carbohydrate ABC transporter permease [Ancylobacter dichloromethanicus]GLK73920.1 binding-protein-dependent transport system inner membrane protein [Ancylobacter dichloromethanicus]
MADAQSRPEGSRGLLWTGVTVVYAAIMLFPIFWMASMMVKPNDAMFARPTQWLFVPTLEHFSYVIEHGFHWYLLTSFLLCTVSTALVVIIGTPAAYAFARFEMRAKDDLFLFILASRMAPPVCLVIPFYLIFAKVGLLDTFLGLTLAYMTFNLSFYIWVLRSFCRDLPVQLEEAAALEGWSKPQIFRRVVFPLLRNGIVATAVLCFIFAWNEFLFAFMLGGRAVQTLPVSIPKLITSQGVRWGEMAVVGMTALLPVLAVVFVLQRHIVRGLTLGAVKG